MEQRSNLFTCLVLKNYIKNYLVTVLKTRTKMLKPARSGLNLESLYSLAIDLKKDTNLQHSPAALRRCHCLSRRQRFSSKSTNSFTDVEIEQVRACVRDKECAANSNLMMLSQLWPSLAPK